MQLTTITVADILRDWFIVVFQITRRPSSVSFFVTVLRKTTCNANHNSKLEALLASCLVKDGRNPDVHGLPLASRVDSCPRRIWKEGRGCSPGRH